MPATTTTQLYLFEEKVHPDFVTNPVFLESKRIPTYCTDSISISEVLRKLGYTIIQEGAIRNDKTLKFSHKDTQRLWKGKGVEIYRYPNDHDPEISIFASEKRRNDVMQIVEALQIELIEAGKNNVKYYHSIGEHETAKQIEADMNKLMQQTVPQ